MTKSQTKKASEEERDAGFVSKEEREAGFETTFKDRVEHTLTNNYLLGIAVGWEGVEGWLRKQAGEAFAAGKDERALLLRELATKSKEMAEEARAHHKKHGKDYEQMREEDWEE